MIRCEDALGRPWEFLDGPLDYRDEGEIRRHLEVCSRCYPRFDFQRAHLHLMRRVRDRDSVSRQLRRRLFERILEEDAQAGRGEAGGVA